MEVRILGPLEVLADGHAVALPGPKLRALLAVLALHPDQSVSAERLALALWGEEVPAGSVKTVQVHVSRLRKGLEGVALVETTPAGYRLRVSADDVDVLRFGRLVEAARGALAAGSTERAGRTLREALALWRGPPLEEFGWAPFAAPEGGRWRTCTSRRWSCAWRTIWRPGARASWWASCRGSSRRIRGASVCTRS